MRFPLFAFRDFCWAKMLVISLVIMGWKHTTTMTRHWTCCNHYRANVRKSIVSGCSHSHCSQSSWPHIPFSTSSLRGTFPRPGSVFGHQQTEQNTTRPFALTTVALTFRRRYTAGPQTNKTTRRTRLRPAPDRPYPHRPLYVNVIYVRINSKHYKYVRINVSVFFLCGCLERGWERNEDVHRHVSENKLLHRTLPMFIRNL